MSVAYGLKSNPTRLAREQLSLPMCYTDSAGRNYELDCWRDEDIEQLYGIFEDIIEEGQSYPQERTTKEEFVQYFFSYYAFVVRLTGQATEVVGGFYIKPNFPGRSAHLANYGLLVGQPFRGRGIGNFMVANCIRLARTIGFRALYTNLVYSNNEASIKACHKFGFVQVGRVPNAGHLKNLGYVDALQFYRDLTDD